MKRFFLLVGILTFFLFVFPSRAQAAQCIPTAAWDALSNPVVEGTSVNLNVSGDANCIGLTVTFQVIWDKGICGTTLAVNQPSTTTFNSAGFASTTWVAEYQPPPACPFCGCGDPTYYFTADVPGVTITSASPELQVSKASACIPNGGSCSPGVGTCCSGLPCDGTFGTCPASSTCQTVGLNCTISPDNCCLSQNLKCTPVGAGNDLCLVPPTPTPTTGPIAATATPIPPTPAPATCPSSDNLKPCSSNTSCFCGNTPVTGTIRTCQGTPPSSCAICIVGKMANGQCSTFGQNRWSIDQQNWNNLAAHWGGVSSTTTNRSGLPNDPYPDPPAIDPLGYQQVTGVGGVCCLSCGGTPTSCSPVVAPTAVIIPTETIAPTSLPGGSYPVPKVCTDLGGIIPCGGFPTLENIIKALLNILLIVASVLAIFFIIWGGIAWVISAGDKQKVEEAKKTITYAVVGLIVAFLAFLIVGLIGTVFGVKLF